MRLRRRPETQPVPELTPRRGWSLSVFPENVTDHIYERDGVTVVVGKRGWGWSVYTPSGRFADSRWGTADTQAEAMLAGREALEEMRDRSSDS